jgi:hypothetical protein
MLVAQISDIHAGPDVSDGRLLSHVVSIPASGESMTE